MASATSHSKALHFMQRCRQRHIVNIASNSRGNAYQAPSSWPNHSYSTINTLRDGQLRLNFAKQSGQYSARALHRQQRNVSSQTQASTKQQSPKGVFSPGRPPTEVRFPERPGPSIWTSLKSVLGFKPKSSSTYVPARFNATNNPYRARKKWPPNFKQLHPKHQFHFEKTYRRRMKLKYARPTWTKATKIVQYTLIYGTIIYWVFFLDMEDTGTPFDNFRVWFFDKIHDLGNLPEQSKEEADKLRGPRPKTKDTT